MKLQDQCCTREQGQRLVELGVKPEALFWHMPAKSGPHGEYVRYGYHGDNLSPAFNVAELGELIPLDTQVKIKRMRKTPEDWWVLYGNGKIEIDVETEAQARAFQLIHLLENKLITP